MTISIEGWITALAATVQAVGSVWIFRHSSQMWERTAKAEIERTHAAVDLFGSTLISTLADIRDACKTHQVEKVERFKRKLAEVIRMGQTIRIDCLPRNCMSDFMDVMAHALEVDRVLEHFSPVSGRQTLETTAENARAEASFLMGRIAAHLYGWPMPERPKG